MVSVDLFVATKLENMENLEDSGNSKKFQSLREIRVFLKNLENSGKMYNMRNNPNENVFQQFFLLEMSGKTQGIYSMFT